MYLIILILKKFPFGVIDIEKWRNQNKKKKYKKKIERDQEIKFNLNCFLKNDQNETFGGNVEKYVN